MKKSIDYPRRQSVEFLVSMECRKLGGVAVSSNVLLAGIPEAHTRFTQLPNELGHNAVWDFVRSPDGRFYVSVCGENEKPLTAHLYEYYPETGNLRLMLDVAKVWIVDPQQMPPSKIHTSIDFLPDGRLIMATHNTAPAASHKQWMFEQYYEHTWEGYPGSILMIVDPDTNEVTVRGIPVSRESIYGGMLGDDPRYYYFLGYMRGHFYRLDLETNEVKDYGKLSEYSSCRLVKDAKGRFYGSSYTGGIWRYDPETDEVSDLKVQFHSPNGTKYRRQFIFALLSPRGTVFMVDNVDSEMIELDPETLEVTRHGPIHLPGQQTGEAYGIGGLAADNDFVLYYGLKTYNEYMPIRLVRWDVTRGGRPENLGLVSPRGKDSQYLCEMIFDDKGWLHMVDVCGQFSPYILAVDAGKLQPPGNDAPGLALHPYVEPDYNGVGIPAYMHIQAEQTRVMPLHQQMDWKDTAVRFMRSAEGKVYSINGRDRVLIVESGHDRHEPTRIVELYAGGAALSCADAGNDIAVLTTDRMLLQIDPENASCRQQIRLPDDLPLARLHGVTADGKLIASDPEGGIYAISGWSRGYVSVNRLEPIRLADPEAAILILDESRLLLSGDHNSILVYDLGNSAVETLPVLSPSIRGRSFRAAITGGAVLDDGTVAAGTLDGLFFTLSPDLMKRTVYGRLHSTGSLRGFVKTGGNSVAGIYGDERDAGRLFHFSAEHGFIDLGRPRVTRDNNDQRELDTEWASIHYISCLSYSREDDWLCVASGEFYGCIVRYQGVKLPG